MNNDVKTQYTYAPVLYPEFRHMSKEEVLAQFEAEEDQTKKVRLMSEACFRNDSEETRIASGFSVIS